MSHASMSTSKSEHQVKRGILLDKLVHCIANVVVREGTFILELLACKDQPHLVGWDDNLVLDLFLDHVDGVGRFTFEGGGLAVQRLYKELHSAKIKRGLFLCRCWWDVGGLSSRSCRKMY